MMPIHTVYLGADAFAADTPARWLREVESFFTAAFPDAKALARHLDLESELAERVHRRVADRFAAAVAVGDVGQVVEDLRLDFEDGYRGHDEDHDAERAAAAAAEAWRAGQLPPGFGLRLRSMQAGTAERARRTLERFTGRLTGELGHLPDGFVVTLAKIDAPGEVARLADLLGELETRHGLEAGSVPVELMAETPRSILDAEGRVAAPALVEAAAGRCVGVHFGVYDYTASLGLVAALQGPRHPACDVARGLLQVALAGTGVELSDGSPRRVPRLDMAPAELRESIGIVARDVRHALERGLYRGWDMAPSHVAVRRVAVTAFFLEHLPSMLERARDALDATENAAAPADLEDAATLTAVRAFFERGIASGVLTQDERPEGL